MKLTLLGVVLVASLGQQTVPPPPLSAQEATTLAQLQSETARILAVGRRNDQCLRVIGSTAFCGCLNENLPADVSLVNYVRIASSTADGLTTDDKAAIDAVMAVRAKCALKTN